MTDVNVPDEQANNAPQQQTNDQQVNWEARYKGLVKKVEDLTITVRDLNEQLAAKSSENEQLRSQLVVKDAEKSAVVGERDKMLQQVAQEKAALETELNELRSLKLKFEAIKELGRPELLKIAEKIPAMNDKEALKTVLGDFAGLLDEQMQKRERELLAGVTPPISSAGNTKKSQPGSVGEWENYLNSLSPGSPEQLQAENDYWDWLKQTHSQ